MKDYYFIHRNTPNTEAVIVEYGFLDSPKDDVNQLKNNYEDYAEAVVRAVMKYANKNYIAPEDSDYYTVQKGDTLFMGNNEYKKYKLQRSLRHFEEKCLFTWYNY